MCVLCECVGCVFCEVGFVCGVRVFGVCGRVFVRGVHGVCGVSVNVFVSVCGLCVLCVCLYVCWAVCDWGGCM